MSLNPPPKCTKCGENLFIVFNDDQTVSAMHSDPEKDHFAEFKTVFDKK